jgi:hypothetical protein
MQFQPSTHICTKVWEQKPKFLYFFLSPRGITQSEIIRPWQNLNLTCIFLLCINIYAISTLYIHSHKIKLHSWNWNFQEE